MQPRAKFGREGKTFSRKVTPFLSHMTVAPVVNEQTLISDLRSAVL